MRRPCPGWLLTSARGRPVGSVQQCAESSRESDTRGPRGKRRCGRGGSRGKKVRSICSRSHRGMAAGRRHPALESVSRLAGRSAAIPLGSKKKRPPRGQCHAGEWTVLPTRRRQGALRSWRTPDSSIDFFPRRFKLSRSSMENRNDCLSRPTPLLARTLQTANSVPRGDAPARVTRLESRHVRQLCELSRAGRKRRRAGWGSRWGSAGVGQAAPSASSVPRQKMRAGAGRTRPGRGTPGANRGFITQGGENVVCKKSWLREPDRCGGPE